MTGEGFVAAYLRAWSNGINFKGRTNRKEYWLFLVLHLLVFAACDLIDKHILTFGNLANAYGVISLVPAWAATTRRLHDVDKSGFTLAFGLLLGLVDLTTGAYLVLGWAILILLLCCLPGSPEENRYGPGPEASA